MKLGNNILSKVCTSITLILLGTLAHAQTIHLVTVADRRGFDSIANKDCVSKDAARIKTFFQNNVPANSLKVYQVDEEMATPEAICQKIDSIFPNKNDTLVFYYSGHAANAAEQGGQFFQLYDIKKKPAILKRSTVRAQLCSKGAHLVVLMTDCCNIYSPQQQDKDVDAYHSESNVADYSPIIKELFIKPDGVADLTSSKYGQYSFTGQDGSIATVAWLSTFDKLNSELKSVPGKEISWRNTIQEFSISANKVFKAKYPEGSNNQMTQVPHVYEYPAQSRLGIRALTHNIGNLLVGDVLPDSPGEKAGIRPGDIITKINGEEVLDESDYSRCIDISNRNATISYKRNGQEQTVNVELRGLPVAPLSEPTNNNSNQHGGASEDTNVSTGNQQDQGSVPVFGASMMGTVFVKVDANSPAARAGIEVNDVLLQFNDITIQSAMDFSRAVDQSPTNAILIIRKPNHKYVQVNVCLNK